VNTGKDKITVPNYTCQKFNNTVTISLKLEGIFNLRTDDLALASVVY